MIKRSLVLRIKRARVVLDTNVYISAMVFGGTPRRIVDLARAGQVETYISAPILLEVAEKLQNKFGWQVGRVEKAVKAIARLAKVVKPEVNYKVVKADADDNKIIECAAAVKADWVVTGDKHLLDLKKWGKVKMVKPKDFWVKLQAGGDR